MLRISKNKKWFTLIEIIISIAILGIIMISILSVYISSINISKQSEFNRVLQENIKNSFSQLAEEIKKNGIMWVAQVHDNCTNSLISNNFIRGEKFCSGTWNKFYLWKKVADVYVGATISDCQDIKQQCYLLKNGEPLTNNLVSVKNVNFIISNTQEVDLPKKLTIELEIRPAIKKWLKSDVVMRNSLALQTTYSERIFK